MRLAEQPQDEVNHEEFRSSRLENGKSDLSMKKTQR